MEQLERVIQSYRFLSMTGIFLGGCTAILAVFYFIKKDVKEAIGILNGFTAKKEIHRLKIANKEKEDNDTVLLQQKPAEDSDSILLQRGQTEELKTQFVITRQIIYIHTREDIEGGSENYEV